MVQRSKFYASASGPKGGKVYKFGISRAAVAIRHEEAVQGIEVSAFLNPADRMPYVRVELTKPYRLLYEGPLQPKEPPESPFSMTTQQCVCGRTMRRFEVEGGKCVGCAGLEPVSL
jgi:hypothetical protein